MTGTVETAGDIRPFHVDIPEYGMTDYDWRTSEAADCRRWRAS
jgi:hypothetical protein